MEEFAGKVFVSMKAVCAAFDLSERTIRRRIVSGRFPRMVNVAGVKKFAVADLETYVRAKQLGIMIDPNELPDAPKTEKVLPETPVTEAQGGAGRRK